MAIPQSFLQELLARADVVEIVGRYVQLKKGGANYMGLCPFHGEKSPSFSVSPSKQFFHCFGCGKNGNAIGFLMEHAGMSFPEAVKDLAQQYGMQVPEDETSPQERARAAEERGRQATLTEVLEKAGAAYRKHLKASPRAIDYLKGRGVSGEIAKQFGLGYAPEGWRSLASVFPNYDDPLLADSGLVIVNPDEDKRYDRFRDRIMFPIRNVKGECIGFGGRVLGEGTPKYLNSPETPVFSKGRELYGLFEARTALREHGYVLVTEGYMDVVALAQLGFPNAVATLGTACTNEHVQKLFRFTDSVVFSFDGDEAGRRAARKALDGALPYATDVRTREIPVPARRARSGQLHPRVRPRRVCALCERSHAAVALPDRVGPRRLRPRHGRRTRSYGGQCKTAVEPAAGRRPATSAAGGNRRAGADSKPASLPGSGRWGAGAIARALDAALRARRRQSAGRAPGALACALPSRRTPRTSHGWYWRTQSSGTCSVLPNTRSSAPSTATSVNSFAGSIIKPMNTVRNPWPRLPWVCRDSRSRQQRGASSSWTISSHPAASWKTPKCRWLTCVPPC